ncbi:galactoside ABC transporter, permease protein [Escherichia coli]|uniref:Galactoside ABC transporter, permease protein n=2 Tax=Gammaproteobacteria TaxID=1236 RepID=A0A376SAK5_ECOLX|nr:galactoside ABC transporter, permease protein [Escherichia coli]
MGLAAVVAATLLQSMDNANKVFPEMATMPIALVILIVCAIGAVIGLINGLIIAYLNVTPFITTLGTMIIVYGINSLYYDFVGGVADFWFRQWLLYLCSGLCRAGEFPSLLHHLLLNCTPNVGHNLTSEGAVYETFI